MLKKMKDKALSKGVQIAINNSRKFKEYGEMLKLNLNSEQKSIEIEVMLDGEKEPLAMRVNKYEIIEEDGKYMIRVHGIETSRAWINAVASSYLEGKSFDISAELAKMLKVVV
ncbi:MAG: hypothetical protein U9R27_05585 [Campylobacterota bacterium]|nr:hypothetical protein [Campylobacterota bacterium]